MRAAAVDDVRRHVRAVSQEVQLFSASLADNVTLFDPSVGDDRIVAALEAVGLGPWYRSLPDGLATPLGASGIGMSAGEAQLLALSRIFIADPSVVVLDEPSSRLDPATERLVEEATTKLLRGRTSIVIAHRAAALANVDDVAVIDNGRVVEHGPRDALLGTPSSRAAQLLSGSEAET